MIRDKPESKTGSISGAGSPPPVDDGHPSPGPGEEMLRWLGGGLVFFGLCQALPLLGGLFRLPLTSGLGIAVLITSGLAGVLYARGLSSPCSKRDCRYRRSGDPVIRVILVLGGLWYLLLWFLAYLLPDSSWDGLWYHNPTIHFWALSGRVHWITADYSSYWTAIIDSFWNGYPKAVELFGFVLIRAGGLPRLLNSINLPWLPLGVAGIFCLARMAGADIRWSAVAGFLFLLIPVNITQTPTTYVDTAAASVFIAGLAMTVATVGRVTSGNPPWKLLPALGCGLGLALGVKGTGVAVLAVNMSVIAVGMIVTRRKRFGNVVGARDGKAADRKGRNRLRDSLAFLLSVMAIALAVGGYWYLRNFLHTGSPLHPVGFAVAGYRIFPGVLDPGSLVVPAYAPGTGEWSQLSRVLFTWGQGWSYGHWKEAVVSYTSRQGGLGYLWLLGCLPAIVWSLAAAVGKYRRSAYFSSGRSTAQALICLALTVMALFVIIPRNHIARFSIWIYGLGLPAFAVTAARISSVRNSPPRLVGKIWVAAVVVIAILEAGYVFANQRGLRLPEYRRAGPDSGLSLKRIISGWGDDYPTGYVWPRLEGSRLEDLIAGQEPAALGGFTDAVGKNRIVGHLTQDRAFGKRPIYFLDRETVADDPDRLRDFLSSRDIRYLIWDTDIPIPRLLARRVDDWHRVNGLFYLLEFFPEPVNGRSGSLCSGLAGP